jgi:hypothetical protein
VRGRILETTVADDRILLETTVSNVGVFGNVVKVLLETTTPFLFERIKQCPDMTR